MVYIHPLVISFYQMLEMDCLVERSWCLESNVTANYTWIARYEQRLQFTHLPRKYFDPAKELSTSKDL